MIYIAFKGWKSAAITYLLTPVIITVTKHARCNESMLACKIIMQTCDLMSEYGINVDMRFIQKKRASLLTTCTN